MKKGILTSRYMLNKLKYGWTIYEFAKNLECTEKEFEDTLMKTFPPETVNYMQGVLKKNQKRLNKAQRISKKRTPTRVPKGTKEDVLIYEDG